LQSDESDITPQAAASGMIMLGLVIVSSCCLSMDGGFGINLSWFLPVRSSRELFLEDFGIYDVDNAVLEVLLDSCSLDAFVYYL